MALIKCNECGHMVSDKATECPYCGCPIKEAVTTNETTRKAIKKKATNTRIYDEPPYPFIEISYVMDKSELGLGKN